MKDWTYSWVSSDNALDTDITPTPIIHLYVRTRWEPASDGMSKPRAELLGYIAYNDAFKTWHIFPHKWEPLQETASNNLAARMILEHFLRSLSKPQKP